LYAGVSHCCGGEKEIAPRGLATNPAHGQAAKTRVYEN
jgi:hypothetical protein